MSKKDFGTKQCPQCGSMMERVEFTPKKTVSKVGRPGKGGFRATSKATGPKEVNWFCPEDFGHTITETQ